MPVYNFKQISPVPSAPDLIDIVLTRTQRRTPTVVHPGYKITRIRSFYMRKIKFTQQTISERLSSILSEFPRLNDVHPFYGDLCNTLYDRDHYKLALGQINTARGLVDAIARDMVRMVKYGDSLYRCKCLKRAALGRMCTVLRRQKAALAYLDEVRRHLSRLPALDPHARTLLLCGCPNVGKSSFLNRVTRANVDVQPYAFTTKSLFVGHCDHRYLRWQVVDTPGLLDHPLEERNTIEMQAVTALAHLTCSVLYFVDVSEQCGYTIERQCDLFHSIRPLFANKELLVIVNKVDAQPWETLDEDKKRLVQKLAESGDGDDRSNVTLLTMSNLSEHGVSEVKAAACDRLLAARVDARVSTKRVDDVMNRLRVVYPRARDGVVRDVCVPESVKTAAAAGEYGSRDRKPLRSKTGYAPTKKDDDNVDMAASKTARDLMWKNGGPGVWAPDYREQYDLADDEWRFDAIPQIMDGRNVCDYVDPDIALRLEALEKEEEQLEKEAAAAAMEEDPESDLEEEEEAVVEAIRDRKKVAMIKRRVDKSRNKSVVPRETRGRAKDKHDRGDREATSVLRKMDDTLGVDTTLLRERGRSVSRRPKRKETNDETENNNDADDMEVEGLSRTKAKRLKKERAESRKREASLARSHSRPRDPSRVGLRDAEHAKLARKKEKEGRREWEGASGEGDRRQQVSLVQWCNTGKKRMGTHYQR